MLSASHAQHFIAHNHPVFIIRANGDFIGDQRLIFSRSELDFEPDISFLATGAYFLKSTPFCQSRFHIAHQTIMEEAKDIKESCFSRAVFPEKYSHIGDIRNLGVLEHPVILDFNRFNLHGSHYFLCLIHSQKKPLISETTVS